MLHIKNVNNVFKYLYIFYIISDSSEMTNVTSSISDIFTQKRQLEAISYENVQKRPHLMEDHDGDNFFDLPQKVKHMFKKHKRISQLYGLSIY